MSVSIDQSVSSLTRYAERSVELVASLADTSLAVAGLSWTIHELVAHLASTSAAYATIAGGQPSPYPTMEGRSEVSQARLDGCVDSTDAELLESIERSVAAVSSAIVQRDPVQPVAWHGGILLSPVAFVGCMTAELMIHGRDVARMRRRDWPIERQDSFAVIEFFNEVSPYAVDSRRAGALSASFSIHFRGYDRALYRFEKGRLQVTAGGTGRADVSMSVDPVDFLLLGYKRRSLGAAILRGGALSWGRRPWLGLRFPSLFEAP